VAKNVFDRLADECGNAVRMLFLHQPALRVRHAKQTQRQLAVEHSVD